MTELGYTSGHLFIISGPAASGKSTLVKKLIERDGGISSFYPRYMTRPRRATEIEGVDGRWLDEPSFEEMLGLGQFTWTFERTNGRYGIKADEIHSVLNSGNDLFLQNAQDYGLLREMKEYFGDKLVAIFIYASPEVVKERMITKPDAHRTGEEETSEVLQTRYNEAVKQVNDFFANEEIRNLYDHVIQNDGTLEEGMAELTKIIQSYRTQVS